MHRFARLDHHRIIGPVGKDLLEVLARACDVGPLDVSAQQRLLFGCDIERRLSARAGGGENRERKEKASGAEYVHDVTVRAQRRRAKTTKVAIGTVAFFGPLRR